MPNNGERSIILRPDVQIERAVSGKSRIVAAMVNETLLLAKDTTLDKAGESPETQYSRGRSYYGGQDVPQDYLEAVKWFRMAGERGHAWGQCGLGICYFHGRGVRQDYVEAVRWYRKAAEQDNAWAQHWLGFCYYNGQGNPQDDVEAAKWFRMAAEQCDAVAQSRLGSCYYYGRGVPQDTLQAYKWFRLAEDQGYKEGYKEAKMDAARLAPLLSPVELETAEQLFREFKSKQSSRLPSVFGAPSGNVLISGHYEEASKLDDTTP
jgi:TPR repeat protein